MEGFVAENTVREDADEDKSSKRAGAHAQEGEPIGADAEMVYFCEDVGEGCEH